MTHLTRIITGFSLTLVFLALPILAGAEDRGNDRIYFTKHENALSSGTASYANVTLTELEEIAGEQFLDIETVRFLEANLWMPEAAANFANVGAGEQVIDLEMMRFLEANLWLPEAAASFAGDSDDYPSIEEVTGLNAGELNY